MVIGGRKYIVVFGTTEMWRWVKTALVTFLLQFWSLWLLS